MQFMKAWRSVTRTDPFLYPVFVFRSGQIRVILKTQNLKYKQRKNNKTTEDVYSLKNKINLELKEKVPGCVGTKGQ